MKSKKNYKLFFKHANLVGRILDTKKGQYLVNKIDMCDERITLSLQKIKILKKTEQIYLDYK